MIEPDVLWEKVGRIGYITLNRPEKLNALSPDALALLADRLDEAKCDEDVRVIVIRGAGRAFSAGYDMVRGGGYEQPDIIDDRNKILKNIELWLKIWDLPKPVIAQVHGYCLAGATQMAVVCDITVVADDAVIGFPQIPSGGGYISPFWTWLVGPKRAKEMSFTPGSKISGKTAAEWGWANRSVPADDLEETVRRMAEEIALVPAEVLQIKKASVNRTMDVQGFRTAITFGAEYDALLHHAEPVKELSGLVRQHGIKGAIEAFRSQGTAPA